MKLQAGRYYKFHLENGDRHYLYRPDHGSKHWFWWEKDVWVSKPEGRRVSVKHVHKGSTAE